MRMTNAEYAKTNVIFLNSCKKANIKPTTRQASKFARGKGAAYKIVILKLEDTHIPDKAKANL